MQALKSQMDTRMNDDELWRAVAARDARLDGEFVFGVSSTQIYCRPSCPARRPNRERVSFFTDPEAAEKAGFRACRRCHPRSSGSPDKKSNLVARACELLEQSEEPVTLSRLSELLGVSPFHVQRTFKKVMGISPRQYAASRRANKFKEGVREGLPITSAMYDAGYSSSSRLYERAGEELGMTPATYSRNGQGAAIRYAVTHCDLGWLLVAATGKGVCAVKLGSDKAKLITDLENEFSAAEIEPDDRQLAESVRHILEHLGGKRPALDLPLDVQATAFQRLVWEALRAIPYGSTRSYGEVAQAIGRPTAVRAVARACATNPVALVIPCHRVIGGDQSLTGYRWGLERKKSLLEREHKAPAEKSS